MHPDQLHHFIRQVVAGMGSTEREAELVADQLIGANLAGHDSHGIGMLPSYVEGWSNHKLKINGAPTTVIDRGPIVVLDGNHGFGQVMAYAAAETAIERARAHGVAVVGLRNSYHIGRIGHWAEQIAAAGLVSIHFVNVSGHEPLVAPYGGALARLGTNPFCVAIPGRDGRPAALLDMATSKIAFGKARVAYNRGESVPADCLLDRDGRVTTDPTGMFGPTATGGALIAFGEHKGSGLALMCELLGAALIGGLVMSPESAGIGAIVNNMLTIALDPQALGGGSTLIDEANAFLDYMRSSALREGFDEILIPGEPEQRARMVRAAAIDVDATTLGQLRDAAAAVGVSDAVFWAD